MIHKFFPYFLHSLSVYSNYRTVTTAFIIKTAHLRDCQSLPSHLLCNSPYFTGTCYTEFTSSKNSAADILQVKKGNFEIQKILSNKYIGLIKDDLIWMPQIKNLFDKFISQEIICPHSVKDTFILLTFTHIFRKLMKYMLTPVDLIFRNLKKLNYNRGGVHRISGSGLEPAGYPVKF
jgi:Putative RRM domain